MRTDCKVDKWLIIELPQVIRPDTLRVSCAAEVSRRLSSHMVLMHMQFLMTAQQTSRQGDTGAERCNSPTQVSQHELYSSRIKDFEVWGRQKHPRHDAAIGSGEPGKGVDYARSLNSTAWKLVGNFTAAKVKGTQSFKVGMHGD